MGQGSVTAVVWPSTQRVIESDYVGVSSAGEMSRSRFHFVIAIGCAVASSASELGVLVPVAQGGVFQTSGNDAKRSRRRQLTSEPEAGVSGEPTQQIVSSQRRREVVALDGVATCVGEDCAGDLVFGTLGDDRQAERVRHRDGGTDDDRVALVGGHVGDERAVELQFVSGQAVQVGERRIAGPIVVDRDPNSEVGELAQHIARFGDVGHDLGLGDLECERARRKSRSSPGEL